MKPLSTSPITFAAGRRTSEKNSSAVSDGCWPTLSSLRPRSKPGMPVSTANSVMPFAPFDGSVRAATTIMSAV